MKYFFDIKDYQIESGRNIYPFYKVSQIYIDSKNHYYHCIMDNNVKFAISYDQYNEYMNWLSK